MIPADTFDYVLYVGGIVCMLTGAGIVAWQETLARRSARRYPSRFRTIGYCLLVVGILAEIARPFLKSFVFD